MMTVVSTGGIRVWYRVYAVDALRGLYPRFVCLIPVKNAHRAYKFCASRAYSPDTSSVAILWNCYVIWLHK